MSFWCPSFHKLFFELDQMTGINEWAEEYKNVTRSVFFDFSDILCNDKNSKGRKSDCFFFFQDNFDYAPKKPNGHFWVQN